MEENLEHLREREWWREAFIPRDTITYDANGRQQVNPGGWDHEHCDMCFDKIDEQHPLHYANEKCELLCDTCHQKYAVEGSLDFLIGYGDETHP